MVTLLDAFILAIVQGITEWLPISSSGHLVIAQQLLGIEADVFFDVMLHVGTLIAVIAVFWRNIIGMIKAFFTADFKSLEGKTAVFIIFASVPTALAGYFFIDFFESLFTNLFVVGIALIITGFWLFGTKFINPKGGLNYFNSFIIGVAQAIAIVPGISRSGATISIGMFTGVNKNSAVVFSFLLAIPAIIGAAIFKAKDGLVTSDITPVFVGVIVSAVVGYISIRFLINIIRKGKFYWFAIYCWVLGSILILLS